MKKIIKLFMCISTFLGIQTVNANVETKLEDIRQNQNLIAYQEKYIKTTYKTDAYGNTISFDEEISAEEYDNATPSIQTKSIWGSWETTYKLISAGFFQHSGSSYNLVVNNQWKSPPAVSSYDVIGCHWTYTGDNPYTITYYSGQQVGTIETTNYSMNGANSNYTSNGVGISMNLHDLGAVSSNSLSITGTYSGVSFTIYCSYQHATQNITLAQSKSYSFSTNGLGKVFYYPNSTIRGYYDNTQGIKLEI